MLTNQHRWVFSWLTWLTFSPNHHSTSRANISTLSCNSCSTATISVSIWRYPKRVLLIKCVIWLTIFIWSVRNKKNRWLMKHAILSIARRDTWWTSSTRRHQVVTSVRTHSKKYSRHCRCRNKLSILFCRNWHYTPNRWKIWSGMQFSSILRWETSSMKKCMKLLRSLSNLATVRHCWAKREKNTHRS